MLLHTDMNMSKEIYGTGKTVDDAVEDLKKQLGVDTLDGFDYSVIEIGNKGGLFGIGAKPYKLLVTIPDAEPKPEEKPAQKPAAQKPAKVQKSESAQSGEEKKTKVANPEKMAEAEKAALSFIDTLISNLGIDAKTSVSEYEDGKMITIDGSDAAMLIGHHGDTLDAVQYLATLAANLKDDKTHTRIVIDIENYRAKREATLRALAHRMAAKVLKYKKSITLEPMNPYERRIIHSEIQNIDGVSTSSVGVDSGRKVVIYLSSRGLDRRYQRDAKLNEE